MSSDLLRRAAERLEALIASEPGYAGDESWCPDWTYEAVRHVQRNMDIECPVHQPWNGPDRIDECGRWGRYDGRFIATMRQVAPTLPKILTELATLIDLLGDRGGDLEDDALTVARAVLGGDDA